MTVHKIAKINPKMHAHVTPQHTRKTKMPFLQFTIKVVGFCTKEDTLKSHMYVITQRVGEPRRKEPHQWSEMGNKCKEQP